MRKVWSDPAWDDYVWWQSQDRKTLKRINKLIKDIDELYGDYQAGEEIGQRHPLIDFTKGDAEPSIVYHKGGEK